MEEPDIIEVEVERLQPKLTGLQALMALARRFLGPLAIGALVDLADFLSFGPFGILSMPFGMLAGYVASGLMGAAPTWRIALAVGMGVYCVLPLDWLPLATSGILVLQLMGSKAIGSEPFGRR